MSTQWRDSLRRQERGSGKYNGTDMKMTARDIARFGLMVAAALVLSWVETLIPFVFPLPGMKIGLANIVILTMLYAAGAKSAAAVSFLRLLLVLFTFGNAASFLYSLAGAALSFAVMLLLKKTGRFGVTGVSIAGAMAHNAGQIIVAALVLETVTVVYYLPWLMIAGVVSGLVIGIAGGLLSPRLVRFFKVRDRGTEEA